MNVLKVSVLKIAVLPAQKSVEKQFQTHGNGELILLVEDDPMVCRLAVRRLQLLGYKVIQADSASSALALLQEQDGVDLLFSDVIMPGALTGIDLARQARRLYPNLKVLLASGYSAKALDVRDTETVINKPYTMTTLSETLRNILES